MDQELSPLLKRPRPAVPGALLADEIVQGTRPYLEKMAFQANGRYGYAFYDACAVICRRVIESLLIDAFDGQGHIAAITNSNGDLCGLEEIIGVARSGQYLKLPRRAADVLDKIKRIGDTAVHDRYHIATKHDMDEFCTDFRKVISQLLGIAGIISSG